VPIEPDRKYYATKGFSPIPLDLSNAYAVRELKIR
jgi:hypothetical protein